MASAVLGLLAGLPFGALLAGLFGGLFLVVLVALRLRGARALDAGRRAYLFTFGWANWV
ncbi:hypothetical protein [Streptomyces sp. NPDC048659]|uniref:hypothetical protein n=1 Tax=Streptomyces sp. NPDC048659 TaxID=3155489 RepID=UPI00343FD67E